MKYADYMNIMTYDLAGGNTPYTAHHTNMNTYTYNDIKGTPAFEILTKREYKAKNQIC